MLVIRALVLALLFLFYLDNSIYGSYFDACTSNKESIGCSGKKRLFFSYLYDRQQDMVSKQVINTIEQCNGHHSCNVAHSPNECMEGIVHCAIAELPALEIKKSSTVRLESDPSKSAFYLISENYLKGQYMDAENIHCHVRYLEKSKYEGKRLHFTSYEFAPFTDSKRFCLRMQNLTEPLTCSGSGKLYTHHGSYDAQNEDGWNFHLTLDDKGSVLPRVRFWMFVGVTKTRNSVQLECNSKPALQVDKSQNTVVLGTRSKKDVFLAVLSVLCVVFAVAFLYMMMKSRRLSRLLNQTTAMPVQQVDQLVEGEINKDTQRQAPNYLPFPNEAEGHLQMMPNGQEASLE